MYSFVLIIIFLLAIFPDISSRPELRAYHSFEIPLIFPMYNVFESFRGLPLLPPKLLVVGLRTASTAFLAQLGGSFFNQTGATFSQPRGQASWTSRVVY